MPEPDDKCDAGPHGLRLAQAAIDQAKRENQAMREQLLRQAGLEDDGGHKTDDKWVEYGQAGGECDKLKELLLDKEKYERRDGGEYARGYLDCKEEMELQCQSHIAQAYDRGRCDERKEIVRHMAAMRIRDLIERCEFPERKAELRETLKEVEARDGKR